ncbi:MAG: DNA repair protein RecN [Desulforhopalus sp.]|nr:DNA repair protein RecN [Desulforhopalus sp.]
MLCELRVKNLALIESLELSFDQGKSSGLVVMTGETGAGKSIMLRAIQLLTGGRASVDWIRSGEESCEVEALFELSPQHGRLLQRLEEGGFGSDTSVVVRRMLHNSGRSRFYINGSMATAKNVADLTADMLNVASQHDHQQLLQPTLHLDILDTLGELWPERQELARSFELWQTKREALAALRQQEQEKEQKQDFLRFQVAEIRQAGLQPGEEEELSAEKKRLKNAQALIKVSQESYHLLGGSLLDGLIQLRQNMGQMAVLDPAAVKLAEDISGYTFLAEDYVSQLREYRDLLHDDPYRLDQVNERLDLVLQMKRKYGDSIEAILDFAEKCEAELVLFENMDKTIAALEKEVQGLERDMVGKARQLSRKRRQTGQDMEKAMGQELASLAFDRAGFVVHWREVEEIPEKMRVSGWDRGEFYFSPNPGEPARPLAKIASGGELSRLMLAMKCLLAKKDMVDTVIFDEVDAGIGGQAAEAVARKIQELAGHHQVFCITHLPQIAARGTQHFQVSKAVEGGRTQSAVVRLSPEDRVRELARMLAGDSATAQTHAFAKELLGKGGVSV